MLRPQRHHHGAGTKKQLADVMAVCSEFNTIHGRWTREKHQEAILDFKPPEPLGHDTIAAVMRHDRRRRVSKSPKAAASPPDGHYLCTPCSIREDMAIYKPVADFSQTKRTACISCGKAYQRAYRQTYWGNLARALKSANQVSGRTCLTMKHIHDAMQEQQGLCYYSGMLMRPSGDWQVGLRRRRLDECWAPDNILLACREFNSSDFAPKADSERPGGAGWSQEKVAFSRAVAAGECAGDAWMLFQEQYRSSVNQNYLAP